MAAKRSRGDLVHLWTWAENGSGDGTCRRCGIQTRLTKGQRGGISRLYADGDGWSKVVSSCRQEPDAAGAYEAALAWSTRCKLRATAARAEGNDGAAMPLFREAAETERRALAALTDPSPETELRSLVEQCGCLLDGNDRERARSVWAQIVRVAGCVPEEVRRPILVRIAARTDMGGW